MGGLPPPRCFAKVEHPPVDPHQQHRPPPPPLLSWLAFRHAPLGVTLPPPPPPPASLAAGPTTTRALPLGPSPCARSTLSWMSP